MFEVTIRTDNQAALQELMEFLAKLDLKILEKKTIVPDFKNGNKMKPALKTEEVTVQIQEKKDTGEELHAKPIPSIAFAEWTGVAPDPEKYKRGFGCLKGMIVMSPDFDEPLEDFKEYN